MPYNLLFSIFDLFVDILFKFIRNLKIAAGPFKGMAYIQGAVGSSLTPKILGTYEMELSDWISGLPHFPVALDVGAAEGYYAVGLLKKQICDRVIAWEMNPEGQALMEKLAQANGMRDRLEILGRCDSDELSKTIAAASTEVLLVVDCEGFEGPLLEPISGALLSKCSLLIETHDPMNPGVHGRLKKHLETTHEILEVYPKRRQLADLPAILPGLLGLLRLPILSRLAMSERRCNDIGWLLCKPKAV